MPTVAEIEQILIRRDRRYLEKTRLDFATMDGTNADLRDSIYAASVASGLAPADSLAVTDEEVAGLAGFARLRFLDLAELALLETCLGNWAEVDQTDGAESQSLSQLTKDLQERIAALTAKLKEPYGTPEQVGMAGGSYVSGRLKAGRCVPELSCQPYYDAYGRLCYR